MKTYVKASFQSSLNGEEKGLLERIDIFQGHGVWNARVPVKWNIICAHYFVRPAADLNTISRPLYL